MAEYQGHRSWNAWNVALWIGNDEPLYRMALDYIRESKTRDRAARRMAAALAGEKTPDGARFNYSCIRAAIAGLE